MRCPKFKNPEFSRVPQNFQFLSKPGWPFLKFPGIVITTMCKNAIIYGFPEIHEVKFRFFPEKYRPQFRIFVKIWAPPFLKFPGIVITTMCKNAIIYGFPEILETKLRFFPEKWRPGFLVFVEIWAPPFLKFPGISVDKITKNARIYGFPRILEAPFRFFPGNFYEIPKSPIFLNFRKPRNFGERVTSTKKAPNFQFSPGFTLNFVELIRYTPHPNLYT